MTNGPVHYVALHCIANLSHEFHSHTYSSIGIAQLQTILLCIGNDPNLLEVQPKHSHIKRSCSEFEHSSKKCSCQVQLCYLPPSACNLLSVTPNCPNQIISAKWLFISTILWIGDSQISEFQAVLMMLAGRR